MKTGTFLSEVFERSSGCFSENQYGRPITFVTVFYHSILGEAWMLQRIRSFINSETKKLEGKSLQQKAGYIWDYYKLWIIGIIAFVSFSAFVIHQARTALTDHWFYLMLANTRQEVGTDTSLCKGYVEYSGYDTTEKLIEFNDEAYFDYGKNRAAGNKYYEIFVACTDSGVLDAVTMEPEKLSSLGESGRLMDLRDERCASIYEKYQDRLIYTIPYDKDYSTDPVPIGIDVSDSILISEYHIYTDGCAVGIGAQSSNIEAVEKFLDYIYEGA